MNLILIVSLQISPFGFSFDQILILPSIVQIIAWVSESHLSNKNLWTIIQLLVLFFAVVLKMLSINKIENYWFSIVPILFLPIYLFSWIVSYEFQS